MTGQEAADWLEYMTAPLPMTLAKEREANVVVPQNFNAVAAGGRLILHLPPASVTVVRLEM